MHKQENPQLCNLMVEQADLKKLEDLDPFQTQGFQSLAKLQVPVNIIYTDELNKTTADVQLLTFQVLTRWIKKTKDNPSLQSLKLIITSQYDIFLAFLSKQFLLINKSCSNQTFESLKQKNDLNLNFDSFPFTLIKLLQASSTQQSKTHVELRLTHQGTGRLKIIEETDYKRLQLIELFLQSCNIEKTHQSIIFRYNFNKTKLAMLENSIDTVYKILAEKNPPLLHFIQKNVGIEE